MSSSNKPWTWIAALVSTLLLMVSCHQTAPQRPTRLGEVKVDSAMLRMVRMNEQLADAADRAMATWIGLQPGEWVQMECGAWLQKDRSANKEGVASRIADGTRVELRMKVYTLDGRMIEDVERTVVKGREEGVPQAVVEALEEGLPKARIACPWYCGFGARGDERVGEYENVQIEFWKQEQGIISYEE